MMRTFTTQMMPWALIIGAVACGSQEEESARVSDYILDPDLRQFAVYSANATRVELWLYDTPFGSEEVARWSMWQDPNTNEWLAWLTEQQIRDDFGITGPIYYGYRAWGPNWPHDPAWTPGTAVGFISDVDADGNRFNPNKLIYDPRAREISHDPINPSNLDGTVFASGPDYRLIDSGPFAPKAILLDDPAPVDAASKPARALKDDIVYEVHVRGLTMNDPSIPAQYRGTYRGAALKAADLAALGVTAVEFLPVHETDNGANDADPTSTVGDNYWGYMTLGFFAPDRRYAFDQSAGGPTQEFRQMVEAFHAQDIKVFIDVVYNHTGEGGVWGGGDNRVMNVQSFRGLDNQTWYSLTADRQWPWDNTGVGGNFNTYNPVVQDFILDSLRYWSDNLGVDGFRFDLASVLGNTFEHGGFNYDKFDPSTALNRIVAEIGARPEAGGPGVDLIAEPWAIGGNSYQVGNFPAGWAEWNGQFRDVLRRDQNQLGIESVTPGILASRFAGSSDLYQDDGRKPFHSVNFMVAHDGMSLNDLYTCNDRNNNQAWPYGPSDGGESNNHSWNQGGNPADQRRAARNGFALTMLSAGTPMFTGGDEFLRTQYCNNNVYNLDSVANWLDYDWSPEQTNFRTFAQRMMAFRKAHPALRPADFYTGSDTNGNIMEQLRWFTDAGQPPDGAYWDNPNNHALAWRIDGTELGDSADAIYIAYNGWSGPVTFTLPWPGPGKNWYRVTDTCNWAEGPNQVAQPGQEAFIGGEWTPYGVCGRGILVLIAR